MKSCEEMAKAILERRDRYRETRQKKTRLLCGSLAACVVFAACAVTPLVKYMDKTGGSDITGALEHSQAADLSGAQSSGKEPPMDGTYWEGNYSVGNGPDSEQEPGQSASSAAQSSAPSQSVSSRPGDDIAHRIISGREFPWKNAIGYEAPANGEWFCHMEVNQALKDWARDSLTVFVLGVDVFKNGELLGDVELEQEEGRLAGLGYKAVPQPGLEAGTLCLWLTADELKAFPASPDYGYTFHFLPEQE